jgi:hypothetical protein
MTKSVKLFIWGYQATFESELCPSSNELEQKRLVSGLR